MAVAVQEVETLQRSFRAKQIVRRAGAVRRLADGRWEVESQSTTGKKYVVGARFDYCTCPDYPKRRPLACKHIMAAVEADTASKRRKVIIENWDPTSGKVLAWRYANEPICAAAATRPGRDGWNSEPSYLAVVERAPEVDDPEVTDYPEDGFTDY